jgi:hypothetical protein
MKIKFTPTYQEWRRIGNQYAIKNSKKLLILTLAYSVLVSIMYREYWLRAFFMAFAAMSLLFLIGFIIMRLVRLKKIKKIFSETDQTTEYDINKDNFTIISKASKFEGKTKDYIISTEVKDAIYIANKYNKRAPSGVIPKRAFKTPADLAKFKSLFDQNAK